MPIGVKRHPISQSIKHTDIVIFFNRQINFLYKHCIITKLHESNSTNRHSVDYNDDPMYSRKYFWHIFLQFLFTDHLFRFWRYIWFVIILNFFSSGSKKNSMKIIFTKKLILFCTTLSSNAYQILYPEI